MVKAVKIINEGKELEIDFGDEIRIYTARDLRINCGCANCETSRENRTCKQFKLN